MSKRFVAAIAGLVALSALAYFSLVKDWFVPRTLLAGYFAVATSSELNLSHIDEWNQAAADKYGPGASTAIRGKNWEAYVGDKIVETRAEGSIPVRIVGRPATHHRPGVHHGRDQGQVLGNDSISCARVRTRRLAASSL